MASEKYWKQGAFISNRTFSKNKKRSGTTVPGWCSTWFFKENITLVLFDYIYILFMPYDLLTMYSNIDFIIYSKVMLSVEKNKPLRKGTLRWCLDKTENLKTLANEMQTMNTKFHYKIFL